MRVPGSTRRQARAMALAAAASLLLSGCYGTRLQRLELRTARIEDQLQKLGMAHSELSSTVQALNRLVEEEVGLARSGRAGNEERLREIQRLLGVLSTRMEESRTRYSELKDELQYKRPDPSDTTATLSTPRALYDTAFQDLTRGNHGLALMGFQEMLAKYPTSELADNAQYWIGESYYTQKDYKQALDEFRKTVDLYPDGDKVPAALLKSGYCQQALGDRKGARATFQSLLQRFPHTEEARLAGTRLEKM